MSQPLVERRNAPRYIVLFHATGLLRAGGISLPCQLIDVSLFGARVAVTMPVNLTGNADQIPSAHLHAIADLRGSHLPSGHVLLPIECARIVHRSRHHIDIAGPYFSAAPLGEAVLDEWVQHGRAVILAIDDDVIRLKGRPPSQALWRLDRYMLAGSAQRIELDPECPHEVAQDLRHHFRHKVQVDVGKKPILQDLVDRFV